MIHIVPTASALLVTAPSLGGSGFALPLGVTTLLACAAAFWAVARQRTLASRLAALEAEQRKLQEANKGLRDKERKATKALEARKEEVGELRRDLSTQRKKNHAAQEENKKLRGDLRDQHKATQAARKARPAFEEPAAGPTVPEETKPPPVERRDPPPAPEASMPPPEPRQDGELKEANAEIARLQSEASNLKEKLTAERDTTRNQKAELKRLRLRAEQLRRIDIVTKGRMEVLEDKLRTLGREYYNTVSDLALLKGEVKPLPREAFAVEPQPDDPETEAALRGDGLQESDPPEQTDAEAASDDEPGTPSQQHEAPTALSDDDDPGPSDSPEQTVRHPEDAEAGSSPRLDPAAGNDEGDETEHDAGPLPRVASAS